MSKDSTLTSSRFQSDPTHSFLSKDHFVSGISHCSSKNVHTLLKQNLILNEPAGKIAMVVVAHATKLVVRAWGDTSANVHQITEEILECMYVYFLFPINTDRHNHTRVTKLFFFMF